MHQLERQRLARVRDATTIVGIIILVATPNAAFAQRRDRTPHLAYMYPAGCERGMTCEVTVGGQHLKEANEVYVSGDGVTAEIVGWYRPLTAGEYNSLRMKLSETRERLTGQATLRNARTLPSEAEIAEAAGITEEQLREMEIYRQRDRDPKRQPNEQLEEQVTLRITVEVEAELGKREMRFLSDDAISNPIWLHLDRWIQFREYEPNDIAPCLIEDRLPVVINGQILPGDVDRFRFEAKQGMRLVVQVAAREVIPYLADAVPGWFQSVVRVTDAGGKEIEFADSFYYRQDPLLSFEVPRDGSYIVEIRDSLYRGREDFVYRMTIGETPLVTSIFPLGARVDSEVKVQLRGWNLSRTEQAVTTMPRDEYRPTKWYSSIQGDDSVRFPMRIDYWPEVFEEATNDDQQTAQEIEPRVTINGRIERAGDRDVYRIRGSGRLIAEVHARRLGSPLDSILTLIDSQGNELAFNDDHVDKSQAMLTHHADSHLTATVPAKGDYFLTIADAQGNGGPDFGYRLSVRSPQADYELRVLPASIMARAGQVVPITVIALRKDGFDQDIDLELVDPPPGFRLDGGRIPGSSDQIKMTLTVPDEAAAQPVRLQMQGSATKRLRSRSRIVRPAVPAENMMQAFIWHHLVPVENWNVVINGRRGAKRPLDLMLPREAVSLPPEGEHLLFALPVSKNVRAEQLSIELHEGPEGVEASIVADPMGSIAIKLAMPEHGLEPGLSGNLLMSLYREVTPEPTEANPAPKPRRTNYGYLPAIPYQIGRQ